MTKLYTLAMLLLFNATISFAQKNSFRRVSYTVPEGYQLLKNDNLLSYFKQDSQTGAYCKFVIYKAPSDQDGPQKNFDFFWTHMVQKAFNLPGTANVQPQATIKGWDLLMGTTLYNDNGVSTLLLPGSFSGENSMQNIIVQSNADIYKPDIESFIASVDVVKDITSPPPAKTSNTTGGKEAAKLSAAAASSSNIKYEVWECNCASLETNTLITTNLKTVVIAPDGKYLTYMPEKGLNGVTPQNSNESGSWGNLTDKGIC